MGGEIQSVGHRANRPWVEPIGIDPVPRLEKGVINMTSLLKQPLVENILATARQNLVQDGHLVPVLFVAFARGKLLAIPLQLPDTPDRKWAYFRQLGRHLQATHGSIREALLVTESWFVDARTAPGAATRRPSQHPSRQEAITLNGRNARGDRYTSVVQPLIRDEHHQPVWQDILLSDYNQPVTAGKHPVGVLDKLFSLELAVR